MGQLGFGFELSTASTSVHYRQCTVPLGYMMCRPTEIAEWGLSHPRTHRSPLAATGRPDGDRGRAFHTSTNVRGAAATSARARQRDGQLCCFVQSTSPHERAPALGAISSGRPGPPSWAVHSRGSHALASCVCVGCGRDIHAR